MKIQSVINAAYDLSRKEILILANLLTKPRVPEAEGVSGEFTVEEYDALMRRLRDKGYLDTDLILNTGIRKGCALEIGPGPGYLGLEWLRRTTGTFLKGLDMSSDMLVVAKRNAAQYGLTERCAYFEGRAQSMPFGDEQFDAVFSNGSLHEWTEPERVFNELHRVLKVGGRFCITDLRRDMNPIIRWFLKQNIKPKARRVGFLSSVQAAYTPEELSELLRKTNLAGAHVRGLRITLAVSGNKSAKFADSVKSS
jgi:ubiquinone/menaquinone biosynthesis C-methylase UbiE